MFGGNGGTANTNNKYNERACKKIICRFFKITFQFLLSFRKNLQTHELLNKGTTYKVSTYFYKSEGFMEGI